jgi:hypothetical protein
MFESYVPFRAAAKRGQAIALPLILLSVRPPRMLSGPENLQCRAAFIQFHKNGGLGPAVERQEVSNLFLTRSSVESPSKLCPSSRFLSVKKNGEPPSPIRQEGFSPTPFSGWQRFSQI